MIEHYSPLNGFTIAMRFIESLRLPDGYTRSISRINLDHFEYMVSTSIPRGTSFHQGRTIYFGELHRHGQDKLRDEHERVIVVATAIETLRVARAQAETRRSSPR